MQPIDVNAFPPHPEPRGRLLQPPCGSHGRLLLGEARLLLAHGVTEPQGGRESKAEVIPELQGGTCGRGKAFGDIIVVFPNSDALLGCWTDRVTGGTNSSR